MKNYWLERRPQIMQMMDDYNEEFYLKWYIKKTDETNVKFFGWGGTSYFLHKDGIWRTTTYDDTTGAYSGYYDSWEEAYERLMTYKN